MGKHQSRLLRFALKYPCEWHSYGTDDTTTRAVRSLERAGALEVKGRQFRLNLPRDKVEVAWRPDIAYSA
jgi:hypothetical protein